MKIYNLIRVKFYLLQLFPFLFGMGPGGTSTHPGEDSGSKHTSEEVIIIN